MSRWHRLLLTAGLLIIVSACGPFPTPSIAPPSTGSSAAATVASPSAPPPSSLGFLSEEELAPVSLEDERPTAICDTEPRTSDRAAPQSHILCYDGLEEGLRALRTRLASVDLLYLRYGPCAAVPCTQGEVDTIEVIGWSGNTASSVVITYEPRTITIPSDGASKDWPSASSSKPPPVARPSIAGAAKEMQARTPYPFCGRTTRNPVLGTPTERPGDSDQVWAINRCFFDGIFAERPVEMIEITAVTRQPVLLRFDGSGFVTRYISKGVASNGSPKWYRNEGPIIVNSSVFFGLAFQDQAVRVR
jgi:hypothetical protein